MKRLRSPLCQPGVEGARHGPYGVLQEAKLVCEFMMVWWENESAHDDIGMAVNILGETVQDNVGP